MTVLLSLMSIDVARPDAGTSVVCHRTVLLIACILVMLDGHVRCVQLHNSLVTFLLIRLTRLVTSTNPVRFAVPVGAGHSWN